MFEQTTSDGIGIFAVIAEETDLNTKLQSLRAGGWQALRDMPRRELDELADKVAHVQHIGNFTDDVSAMRSEASQAIRSERVRRDTAQAEQTRRHQQGKAHISRAANLIAEARDLCGYAMQVEVDKDAPSIGKPLEVPAVEAMSDDELSITLDGYRAELDQISNLPEVMREQSSSIALLKTDDAKAISRELKADADAYEKRRESLIAAAQVVRAEIERRAAEREAHEEALRPRSLLERIEALEAEARKRSEQ